MLSGAGRGEQRPTILRSTVLPVTVPLKEMQEDRGFLDSKVAALVCVDCLVLRIWVRMLCTSLRRQAHFKGKEGVPFEPLSPLQNLERNPRHYALPGWGASRLHCNAATIGAGLHFNAMVPWRGQVGLRKGRLRCESSCMGSDQPRTDHAKQGTSTSALARSMFLLLNKRAFKHGLQRSYNDPCAQLIKYGVMERSTAVKDLLSWELLYLAGRLHKPVQTLKACSEVLAAQKRNVSAAIATALLLCKKRFTKDQFLHSLCAVSYHGASIIFQYVYCIARSASTLACANLNVQI